MSATRVRVPSYRSRINLAQRGKEAGSLTLGIDMTMVDGVRICGSGLACEEYCPVMSMGRICPSVTEFLDEVAAMGLTPAEVRAVSSLV